MAKRKILDCVEIINKRVQPYDGCRTYLDTGGLNTDKIIDTRDFDFKDKPSRANQNVRTDDIILARMKGTTKVKVISSKEADYMVSTGFIVLRAKNGLSSVNYLNHLFLSDFFQREKDVLCTGATQKAINNTNFEKLEIYLPPLDQQKQIAKILDTADTYRQKTKTLIEKYDELTQSLFLDMFGDPVTNPKGWEVKSFEEMVSPDCPLTYGIVQPGDEVADGVPCVRPVDLTKQYVSIDNLKRIDSSISEKFNRTLLKGGEILLSVRGSVGVISIADASLANSNVTRGIVPIWFDKNISNKLFFYYLYKSLPIQRRLSELAKGATLIQLNLRDLRELKLIKPPLETQNQFSESVRAIEAQKLLAQKELEKAETLFNSLLQKAFKGELV